MHGQYSKTAFIQIGFAWRPQVYATSGNKGEALSERSKSVAPKSAL